MTKQFPEGFPRDGVVKLQGKEYITHTGLVWLATQQGPWSSSVDHVERVFDDQGLPLYMEVHVTVTSGEVSHTAIGDASRANVGKMIATALPRMAHTRALNRALRCLIGEGATTAEEIPDSPRTPQDAPRPRQGGSTPPQTVEAPTGPSRGEQVARSIVQGSGDPECPRCQSRVWDNREQRRQQQAEHDAGRRQSKPGPAWKCSNKQCTGSRNGDPWVGWRADFFGVQGPPSAPAQTAQEQPPPLDPVACGLDERGESFTADQEIPF